MKITKIMTVVLLIIFTALIINTCLGAFSNRCIYPEDGIWYCEELQIYLNFGFNEISKAIVNGKEIDCTAGHMNDSLYITVKQLYYEPDMNNRVIFPGEYVSLKDNELVLRDRYTRIEYVFVRIEGQSDGLKGRG